MLLFLQKLTAFRAYKSLLFCCRTHAEEVSRAQKNNSPIQRQKAPLCLVKVDSSTHVLLDKGFVNTSRATEMQSLK